MNAGACRPAEPEETDRDAEAADKSWREAFFGCELAVFVELGLDNFMEVVEEWRDDEDGAEEDSHECESFLAQVEFVDAFEDDGE